MTEGSLNLRREEYIVEVKTNDKGVMVDSKDLHPLTFPWLKGLAMSFDLYQWKSMSVEYRPAVGTTMDGFVVIGVDWGVEATGPTTVESVYALTPHVETPVWQKIPNMVLPQKQLQLKKWYDAPKQGSEGQPGKLCYYASGKASTVLGHIFVRYNIQLSGTRKAV